RGVKHTLADVTRRHLGYTIEKELQTADWSRPLTADMLKYAALDAQLPLLLREHLDRRLEDADLDGVARVEMQALPCVVWASVRGVGFDRTPWEALAAESEAEAARLVEQLDELAPNDSTLTRGRNWNSTAEVTAAFASLGITLESTEDDSLAAVDHPLAAT